MLEIFNEVRTITIVLLTVVVVAVVLVIELRRAGTFDDSNNH